ncbi:MAG: hypothetical protein U9Q34_05940, partial [Elusimicrobiota bacterium]|nr:hypothetical protein [Elusimicrobiota bacterium]
HTSNKTIFTALMTPPEKEDAHSVMYHWLHIIKNFMPSKILAGEILETLWNFRKFSFKPADIPFRDEIIKAFISNFKFGLMKEDPEILKVKDWLNYLKTDPYHGYMLEIKIIIFNNLHEGSLLKKVENKPFLKTITKLAHDLEIMHRNKQLVK